MATLLSRRPSFAGWPLWALGIRTGFLGRIVENARHFYLSRENSFRGFFEPTEEGSGQLATEEKGDVSRAALSAHSKTLFCDFARALLRLRTANDGTHYIITPHQNIWL